MLQDYTSLANLLNIASLLVNVITLLVVLSFRYALKKKEEKHVPTQNTTRVNSAVEVRSGCRNCGNQYESTEKVYPGCRTHRVVGKVATKFRKCPKHE